MVSAALQTDVSKLESKGFEADQTEIPQDKQGETEFLSTLNIVHHVSPTLNATPSDGNHLDSRVPSWPAKRGYQPQGHNPIQEGKCCEAEVGGCFSLCRHCEDTSGLMGPAGAP